MTDTTREAVERLARKLRTGWPIGPGDRIACDIMGEATDLIEKSQARIAELEAEVVRLSQPAPVEPVAWPRPAQTPPEDVGALIAQANALLSINEAGASVPRIPHLAVEIIEKLTAALAKQGGA